MKLERGKWQRAGGRQVAGENWWQGRNAGESFHQQVLGRLPAGQQTTWQDREGTAGERLDGEAVEQSWPQAHGATPWWRAASSLPMRMESSSPRWVAVTWFGVDQGSQSSPMCLFFKGKYDFVASSSLQSTCLHCLTMCLCLGSLSRWFCETANEVACKICATVFNYVQLWNCICVHLCNCVQLWNCGIVELCATVQCTVCTLIESTRLDSELPGVCGVDNFFGSSFGFGKMTSALGFIRRLECYNSCTLSALGPRVISYMCRNQFEGLSWQKIGLYDSFLTWEPLFPDICTYLLLSPKLP